MLEELTVSNFVLSRHNVMEFAHGLTAVTGETGAGKSLTVDALNMILGARTDPSLVRQGCNKAEIEAIFSLDDSSNAQAFLKEHELDSDDQTLIIRRTLSADGRSRAWVNSKAVTLGLLKELGALLAAIHGQHASVRMLNLARQLQLLDGFGDLQDQVAKLASAFNSYNDKRVQLQKLSDEQKMGATVFKSIRADYEELCKLDLGPGDYENISKSFDDLEHQKELQQGFAEALVALGDEENSPYAVLQNAQNSLDAVAEFDEETAGGASKFIAEALEKIDAARSLIENNAEQSFEDPHAIEEQLSKCHALSSRFKVDPAELYKQKDLLEQRLERFLSLKNEITSLTDEVRTLREHYEHEASELSKLRFEAAQKMSAEVSDEIRKLSMPDAVFKISIASDLNCRPRKEGRDEVVFLFSANRGQDPAPLDQAASGGELSRLALAIEVLTSRINDVPLLIFDEVDTGISGRTASAVGALLRKLGEKTQVFTVTHLPQVAASASSQFLVYKENSDEGVVSRVQLLDESGRIEEIARMMGGNSVNDDLRAGAKALLEHASL